MGAYAVWQAAVNTRGRRADAGKHYTLGQAEAGAGHTCIYDGPRTGESESARHGEEGQKRDGRRARINTRRLPQHNNASPCLTCYNKNNHTALYNI
jgi:hypothetical protein